jgi:hypothetical protein
MKNEKENPEAEEEMSEDEKAWKYEGEEDEC